MALANHHGFAGDKSSTHLPRPLFPLHHDDEKSMKKFYQKAVVDVHLVLAGDGVSLATIHLLQACATFQSNVALLHSSCPFVMKMSTIGEV